MPLLLIPEYSGINKGQRFPDRSTTAHRKPPVKCSLTTKGTFHANMGTVKDRNGKDLIAAENIRKRWQKHRKTTQKRF